ncbi:MAG: 7-cyano-7-deazaguanine synthase [Planctomycetes bacterium]|nr:7-cyano-7-deazaguanine synthase [Planctomycetota bacterium]
MISEAPESSIGLLLSGGLDSSILLGHLLDRRYRVRPFYVRSQLIWQREELHAVRRFTHAMATRFDAHRGLEALVTLDLPMADLYENHWSVTGRDTPDLASPDRAVYLPGRNALLVIKVALWCQLHGIAEVALGVLQSNPFADATPRFFDGFQSALNLATGGEIRIVRPLATLDKRRVMQLGAEYPLELTFSCIAPVDGRHCGRCNKCAERRAAFGLIGREDPTLYAAT